MVFVCREVVFATRGFTADFEWEKESYVYSDTTMMDYCSAYQDM